MESPAAPKSFRFSLRIIRLYKYLTYEKHEYILSRQLLRSGTAIGANIAESEHAQSKADFISKMTIALKEADETRYWLKLLEASDYLTAKQAESIISDCLELIRMLSSIVKRSKETLINSPSNGRNLPV